MLVKAPSQLICTIGSRDNIVIQQERSTRKVVTETATKAVGGKDTKCIEKEEPALTSLKTESRKELR